MTKRHLLLASAGGLAISLALSAPARAQEATPTTGAPEEPVIGDTSPEPTAKQTARNAIIVTGSRIARRDFTSASPIVTVGADRLEQSGRVTLDGALNKLPQLASGTNSTTQTNRNGRASLNLRGLGEERSLILLDGRRIQPATGSGAVDINVLPAILVQNVEVITGGASAVYGSDAMSGVVNFKLRPSYNGVMLDGQGSMTYKGDAEAYEISLLAGGTFADAAGNAMIAMSYANRSPLSRSQRQFTRISIPTGRLLNPVLNLNSNRPSQAAIDNVFGGYGVAPGAVTTGVFGVNPDGTLFTPSPGAGHDIVNYKGPIDATTIISGNNILYNQGYFYDITGSLERVSVFGKIDYEFSDDVKGFAQILHSRYSTTYRTTPSALGLAGTSVTVAPDNQFIPDDLRQLLASRAKPSQPASVVMTTDVLGLLNSKANWDMSQALVGLEGNLGLGDLTWSTYGSLGRTHEDLLYNNDFSVERVQTLLSRSDGGVGICAGGFNIFGPQSEISPTCLDYIRATPAITFAYEQAIAEGTVQGGLFELPGGDLQFSLGASYRWDSYEVNFDDRAAQGDIPGVIGGSSKGSRSVKEVFGELLIPIAKNLPLIKSLDADVGYRHSDYSIGGGVDSYTANLDWTVTRFLRLRGGYSRAIRAPSLEDLFASASQAQLRLGSPSATGTGGDPCDVRTSYRQGPQGDLIRQLCLALGVPSGAIDSYQYNATTIFGTSTGNPDLKPETADTYSVGAVVNSPFETGVLSRLRASIDYFNITIKGAIGQLPLDLAFARCFNLDSTSNPTYSPTNLNCTFFPRNPVTGAVDSATVPLLNLGRYQTAGVDFQVDWQLPLSEYLWKPLGTLQLSLVGTYLDSFNIRTLPGTPIVDYAGSTRSPIDPNGRSAVLPKWKWIGTVALDQGPVTASISWRHISGVFDVSRLSNPDSTATGAGPRDYIDLAARVKLPHQIEMRFTVNNLFNVLPPMLRNSPGDTDTTTYDLYGTYYTVGLRKVF